MARSFLSAVAAMQRDAARAQAARARAQSASARAAERSQAAAVREAARARAAYERAERLDAKERARLYAESRTADVAADNDAIASRMSDLSSILVDTLAIDDYIDLDALKQRPALPAWRHAALEWPEPPPDLARYTPDAPTGMSKMFGGKQHAAAVAAGRAAYEQACSEHHQRDEQRQRQLAQRRAEFETATNAAHNSAREQNDAIDKLKASLSRGEHDAVLTYFDMVLRGSDYPEGFPSEFKLAYRPASRQLVVEFELPTVDVVPTIKSYRYVKSQDSVTETVRPLAQIRSTYASVLAQATLRTMHEIFEADRGRFVDVVVFNGMVRATNRSTGQAVHPCLITVRTTADSFLQLDLAQVDPAACLKHLSASVSRSPSELEAVRPVLEFSMVDERFVEETDVLTGLDQRPNLMELTPTEFEGLIQNLFAKMGLDTKQTRASRDGGVDCVAFDSRAVLGGKVVIQAKRYKHTVGVSAVRDLYGTVLNEGASKGILVTTSGYGKASFDFANGKPLELLDGANLLALLADHAGVEAKIVAPDTWRDPVSDVAQGGASESARATTPVATQVPTPKPAARSGGQAPQPARLAGANSRRCGNSSCSNVGEPLSGPQCPVCFHYART